MREDKKCGVGKKCIGPNVDVTGKQQTDPATSPDPTVPLVQCHLSVFNLYKLQMPK